MTNFIGIVIAFCVAVVIPLQAIVNGNLGHKLHNPLLAALVSFIGGLTALLILLLITTPGIPTWPRNSSVPWYLFVGGLFGVLFVTSSLMLVKIIGPANLTAATVAGQLITALIIEHFGWFNIPQQSISLTRLAGCALLFGGLLLVQMKS